MKAKIISAIKIILPLAFGVFLIWLFYDALCEDQKADLFLAFKKANYFWVVLAMFIGFASHLSRAWRWRYLLESMGHKVNYWNAYHAVMIGYIINYVLPRAGEASRAGVLAQSEKVPFKKGFGSIIAERAIDVGMLGIIFAITMFMQFDMIESFQVKIDSFTAGDSGCGNSSAFSFLGNAVKYGIIIGASFGAVWAIISKSFRQKVIEFLKGVWEGAISIFKTDKKLLFIGHTIFIWVMYVTMFIVVFFALDTTAILGIDAWLAGFIAGTIGLVIVQGGIGVYPAFVGLIVTTYLNPEAPGILPDALALGWLMWASQTVMMIILGLISLFINSKNIKFANNESLESTAK
jgi:uncharacterized membrane protein YbhN (UPF0104 family)